MMSQYDSDEAKLATDASYFFSNNQLDTCLATMRKLCALRPDDHKVLLNKALVEFIHRFNTTRSDSYLAQLKHVATISGAKICLENESSLLDSEDNQRVDTSSVAPNLEDSHQANHGLNASFPSFPSPTAAAAHYNYSLVLFYQRQYIQCERLLARLLGLEDSSFLDISTKTGGSMTDFFSRINFPVSVGMVLCQRIVLLWLEVSLYLLRAERVFEITQTWLQMIENKPPKTPHSIDTSPGGGGLSQTLSILTAINTPLRLFHSRACILTGRINLAGQVTLQLSEDEKIDSDLMSTSKIHRSQPVSEVAVKQTWNSGQARQFLNAELSYLKESSELTIRHLNAIAASLTSTESDRWLSTLVFNNLFLTHFRAGKFALGGFKLHRAIRETDRLASELLDTNISGSPHHHQHHRCKMSGGGAGNIGSGCCNTGNGNCTGQRKEVQQQLFRQTALRNFSVSQHYALLYNSGVQLLFTQKPSAAFKAFLAVANDYPQNPRLWLRLAECCVKVQRPNNLSDWSLKNRANCLIGAVGSGSARKLIVNASNHEPIKPWIESATMPTPTLEFATLCLRNAVLRLPRPPTHLPKLETGSDSQGVDRPRAALIEWANNQAVCSLPSQVPITGLALLQLISSTLLVSAYVSLCLHNPVETVHSAEQILRNGPAPMSSRDADTHSGDVVKREPSSLNGKKSEATSSSTDFGWIGLIAPPAHRYLAKMYLAEAYISLDDLPNASSSLLVEDIVVAGGESLSLLSLHSIDSFVPLQRGRASLDPAFNVPQTHAFCCLASSHGSGMSAAGHYVGSFSECQKSSADIASIVSVLPSSKEESVLKPMPGQSENRVSDFPVTVEQGIGVLLYNLAVCCAVRGDYSVARQLLENSTPGLLASDHIAWNPRRPIIAHGSDEHRDLLYPSLLSNNSIDDSHDSEPSVGLPGHFLRLWIYLGVCEGRIASTLNFVRRHFGHVANGGQRLTDPFHTATRVSMPPSHSNRPVVFEVGERSIRTGGISFSDDDVAAAAMVQQNQMRHPQPWYMQDPPPPLPPAQQQSQRLPGHWGAVSTTSASSLLANDAEWPPL